jgi:putative endonuclease
VIENSIGPGKIGIKCIRSSLHIEIMTVGIGVPGQYGRINILSVQGVDRIYKGYRILEANFRCRFGEIDLIARDGAYLVFIEVKYRSSLKDGDSLEAVNRRKQRKIIRVAEYYLCMHQEKTDLPCRFDVIGKVCPRPPSWPRR